MKSTDLGKAVPLFRLVLISFLLILLTGTSLLALSDGNAYQLKDNYKIKRTSDGTVSLYSKDEGAGTDASYVFTDFNADVLLLVYRRIDIESMISTLSKKYYLSKTDARRSVKMALNELEYWDLIVRK